MATADCFVNFGVCCFVATALLQVALQRKVSGSKHGSLVTNDDNDEELSKDLFPYKTVQSGDNCESGHVSFQVDRHLSEKDALLRSKAFLKLQNQRRSIRFFNKTVFSEELLLSCIATAGTAPSGAHQQPWHFSIVKNQDMKHKIREIVEKEEQINYDKRMKKTWLQDLQPMFANSGLHKQGEILKPYLTDAPYLVIVTSVEYGIHEETGEKLTHYYVKEGVGIAVGLFLSALTNIGLFTLTSTPLNAGGTICQLLSRPANEKVYLLMPVGYPAEDATVPYRLPCTAIVDPNICKERKDLSDIHTIY